MIYIGDIYQANPVVIQVHFGAKISQCHFQVKDEAMRKSPFADQKIGMI